MSLKSVKLLAAVLIMTCGLGLGLGKSWVATADAQTSKPLPAKSKAEDELKRLQAELDALRAAEEVAKKQALDAQKEALRERDSALRATELLRQADRERAAAEDLLSARRKAKDGAFTSKTKKWEYDFLLVSEMDMTKFVAFLQDYEDRGWEYNGLTKYKVDNKLADVWVFRRPVKGATEYKSELFELSRRAAVEEKRRADELARVADDAKLKAIEADAKLKSRDEAKALEADIAKLNARLAELNKGKGKLQRAVFPAKDLPLKVDVLADLLIQLSDAKTDRNWQGRFYRSADNLTVEGDKEFIDWVTATIKKLGEK